jgi:cytochrome c oxidase cbb3-type subunit 1
MLGGLLYLSGMVIMLWNTVMTVRSGKVVETPVPMVAAAHA